MSIHTSVPENSRPHYQSGKGLGYYIIVLNTHNTVTVQIFITQDPSFGQHGDMMGDTGHVKRAGAGRIAEVDLKLNVFVGRALLRVHMSANLDSFMQRIVLVIFRFGIYLGLHPRSLALLRI